MTSVSAIHCRAGLVVDTAPAPERAVGRDGEVVGIVVDQDEPAELADPAWWAAMNRSSCSPARTRKSDRSISASRAMSARSGVASSLPCPASYRWILSSGPIRSRRNIEWWRSMIHSEPRWAIDWIPVVPLHRVEDAIARELEQDHVVEVPAVRDVVPADEPDAVLLAVLPDLPREQGLHVELEERVAAASNGEVGREHGHGREVLRGCGRFGARLFSHGAFDQPRSPRSSSVGLARARRRARPPRPRSRRRSSSRSASAVDGPRRGDRPRRGAAGRSWSGRRTAAGRASRPGARS